MFPFGTAPMFGSMCAQLPVMSDSCDPMDCHLPGSSVHGIFLVKILEWVAMSSSREFSRPKVKPAFPVSPALQVDSLLLSH